MQRTNHSSTRQAHRSVSDRAARGLAAVATAGMLALSFAGPALATNRVELSIEAGARSLSISELSISQVTATAAVQTTGGSVTIMVDDSTGTAAGWAVTMRSTRLVNTDSAGSAIPASHISVGTPSATSVIAGQAIGHGKGPVAGRGGSLDVERTVLSANGGNGLGSYAQTAPIVLEVPAGAAPGTYVGTLTVAFESGAEEHRAIELTVAPPPAATAPAHDSSPWGYGAHLLSSGLHALWLFVSTV